MWERSINWLLLVPPQSGPKLNPGMCLDGESKWDRLLYWTMPKQLSYTGQGPWFLKNFFKRLYLFTFKKRGKEGERERNISVWEIHPSVASCMPLTGDLAQIPGMCPDWELNQQSFGLKESALVLKPLSHTSQGRAPDFFKKYLFIYLREESERDILLLFHSFVHSLVHSCMCPHLGWNPQPWAWFLNFLVDSSLSVLEH